jgi:hypothetical protein
VQEDWTVDLLDLNLKPKGDLSGYVSRGGGADIAYDSTAAIKRTLAIPTVSGAVGILPSDCMRVWYKLLAPDGGWLRTPLGTFMQPAPATQSSTPAATWLNVSASELLQFLTETTFVESYAVGLLTNYVSAIRNIIAMAGGPRLVVRIPDPGKYLLAPLGWDSGVSLLTAVNDLLAAIGYTTAYTDAMGVIRADPLPNFSLIQPSFTFDATTGHGIVAGNIQRSPDPSKIINACKVVGEDARKEPVSATYTNIAAASPISVPRLGRTKMLLIKDSTVADAQAALARAKFEVQMAAANYAPIALSTFSWPFSENLDVYKLVYSTPDEGLVSLLVAETKWSHHVGAGGFSTHTLNAVVAT